MPFDVKPKVVSNGVVLLIFGTNRSKLVAKRLQALKPHRMTLVFPFIMEEILIVLEKLVVLFVSAIG
jgi:hypothetical protein